MAVLTVGTTPVELSSPDRDNRAGQTVQVRVPSDGQTVYVDRFAYGEDETVLTADNGMPVKPGEAWAADLGYGERAWLVVASGTQQVRVVRTSV